MGIVTKTLYIRINPRNYKYYEKKGYIIPRYTNKNGKYVIDRNAYIEVNIFDIMPGCSVPVQIKCDYCGKIYNLPYNDYYDNIHNHNNCIYCKSCAFKLFRSNENHPLWKPEKTDAERIRQRKCMGYSEFVYSVLERDNYTCIRCGCKSKNMEVHHLDGYNSNPTARTDVKNGVTLCEDCHNIFHRIYGHKNNTKSQFLEWMQLDDILLNSSSTNNVKYSRLVYCLEDKRVYNSVLSYCKTHPGLDNSKIYLVCNHEKYRNTAYKKHFFWVDELLELSNDRINEYIDPSGSKKNTTLFTDEDRSIISNYLKYITE